MSKIIRAADDLHSLSRGDCAACKSELIAASGQSDVLNSLVGQVALEGLEAVIARTQRLDAIDVLSGNRKADYFHFIPKSVVRKSTLQFPATYRKG